MLQKRFTGTLAHLVLERFKHGAKRQGAQDDVLHHKLATLGTSVVISISVNTATLSIL